MIASLRMTLQSLLILCAAHLFVSVSQQQPQQLSSSSIQPCSAIHFVLPVGDEVCLSEDVQNNDLIVGEFTIQPPNQRINVYLTNPRGQSSRVESSRVESSRVEPSRAHHSSVMQRLTAQLHDCAQHSVDHVASHRIASYRIITHSLIEMKLHKASHCQSCTHLNLLASASTQRLTHCCTS